MLSPGDVLGDGPPIAIALRTLGTGGGEKVMLRLAAAFAASGHPVHLLAGGIEPAGRVQLPRGVGLVRVLPRALGPARRVRLLTPAPFARRDLLRGRLLGPALPHVEGLAQWLAGARPAAVLGTGVFANIEAALAVELARLDTRFIPTEHVALDALFADHLASAKGSRQARRRRRTRALQRLMADLYPRAQAVVAVSAGVADDVANHTGLARERVRVIHNPVVDADLVEAAREPPPHPWFSDDGPAPVLAMGRLTAQKDFPTLLRALALLPSECKPRLVILGEGRERAALLALAAQLGIAERVSLPGHVHNPFACLARARLLVMSSRFEGLPLALIEALACGCPVVSTDCRWGPREILAGGRWGRLVPVGDATALAGAMLATLQQPPDRSVLRRRAADFAVEKSASAYRALMFAP